MGHVPHSPIFIHLYSCSCSATGGSPPLHGSTAILEDTGTDVAVTDVEVNVAGEAGPTDLAVAAASFGSEDVGYDPTNAQGYLLGQTGVEEAQEEIKDNFMDIDVTRLPEAFEARPEGGCQLYLWSRCCS